MELEKDIQRKVLNYLLKDLKCFCWRSNSVGIYDREKGFFRSGSKRGVSDILCCHESKFIAIECKRPGAKQREDQINFQKSVELAGGEYWVIHSLDELKKIWYNYVKEDKIV